MQDVLNLGGESRMNFPSRLGGNWTWRFKWEQMNENIAPHYKGMAALYERPPKKKKKTKKIKVEDE
jgi:4-alpha-glucanotransferase